MSFPLSGILPLFSGLAYLALCLLIAAVGARKAGSAQAFGREPSPCVPFLPHGLSALLALSAFLFMPCGSLPSLVPAPGGALAALGGLAFAALFSGTWARGRALLGFAASLAVIARHAQERGLPGDLYALDSYVAMPVLGAAEGLGKIGVAALAAASLIAFWKDLSVRRSRAPEIHRNAETAFLAALGAELWTLALAGFWVCLFFPFSFAWNAAPEISVLALNGLLFWGKTLALKGFLEKHHRRAPHEAVSLMLLALGACLLWTAE